MADITSRHVHLRGAIGQIRTGTFESREHLVVPVTALMEGVIHAVNAETPEFVPLSSLAVAPQGWNGRPTVLGHPARDGRQISANDPEVLEAKAFGQIFKSRLEGNKLLMEAWIDPAKVIKIGGERMLERMRKLEPIEVSVGAYVTTEVRAGSHNGKPYKAVWKEIIPDHIAFLPDGIGACSISMGCGTHRAAAAHHLLTAEGFEVVEPESEIRVEKPTLRERVTTLIAKMRGDVNEDTETDLVLAADLYDLEGRRNSNADQSVIQNVHDHTVSLGATCEKEPKTMEENPIVVEEVADDNSLKAACSCEDGKVNKAEIVKALIASKYSEFDAADEKMLEAASDERLASFTALAAAKEKEVKDAEEAKAAEIKAAEDKKVADLKAAEEVKTAAAANKPLTEEDFMRVAPPELRSLISRAKAQDAAHKSEIVGVLKTAQSEYTEDELNAKPLEELERFARAMKIASEDRADYTGRALPRVAAHSENDTLTNPPDSYAAGLEALRKANTVQ